MLFSRCQMVEDNVTQTTVYSVILSDLAVVEYDWPFVCLISVSLLILGDLH